MLANVDHVSMNTFNRDAAIFYDFATMRTYAQSASSGLANLRLTQKDNGLMAAIILFSQPPAGTPGQESLDGMTELSSIQVVGDEFSHLLTVAKRSSYSQLLPMIVNDVVILFVFAFVLHTKMFSSAPLSIQKMFYLATFGRLKQQYNFDMK